MFCLDKLDCSLYSETAIDTGGESWKAAFPYVEHSWQEITALPRHYEP